KRSEQDEFHRRDRPSPWLLVTPSSRCRERSGTGACSARGTWFTYNVSHERLSLQARHGLHYLHGGRPDQDDEHRREDQQQRRKEDLDRRTLCDLLGVLHPLDAQLFGIDLDALHETGTEPLGLGDDRGETAHLAQVAAFGELA